MRLRPRSAALTAATALALATAGAVAAHPADPATAQSRTHRVEAREARRAPQLSAVRKKAAADAKRRTDAAMTADIADLMAPDNAWKIRADRATTLAPDSAAQVANLADQVRGSALGVGHINAYHYNSAIYRAAPGTTRVRVAHEDCQGTGHEGEMYTGRKIFEDVPIPAGAMPTVGTDAQLTVFDPATDRLWDFWVTKHHPDGSWSACWGGRIDDVSASRGMFPGTEGASASGLAIAGGAITTADVRRGRIDHALNLNVLRTAGWQTWTWPAVRADGVGPAGPGSLRQGQRLRLDPAVDVDALGLPRLGTMIARAAQQYGIVVTDNSGTVSFMTESGLAEKARTGRDPWETLLGGQPWEPLKGFPWHRMQALPLAYGR